MTVAALKRSSQNDSVLMSLTLRQAQGYSVADGCSVAGVRWVARLQQCRQKRWHANEPGLPALMLRCWLLNIKCL